MHPGRIVITAVASGGVGLGCLCLLGGCTDESKTTGTQVQLTDEDKAFIGQMREVMKTYESDQKKERAEERKARRK